MYSSLILLPFLSVILLNLPFRNIMRKAAFWLCLAVLLFQACLVIFPAAHALSSRLDLFGAFLKFNFTVDNLSRLMLLCISIVLLTALFVQKYIISDEQRVFNFANMSLLILAGLNGMVMVRDIFSLYVFLEISAVCSFILIAFNKDVLAFEAAFKYMLLSVVATVMMLSAIALMLIITGDTNFSAISAGLGGSPNRVLVIFAMGILISACFIKAGLVPFHGWLPDAYSAAPASVSVLLAGIVTKTVGVYALIRVLGFMPATESLKQLLLVVGALSVVFGALAALGQSDFKRMLAYSSISQVGYIVLGLGCATELGLAGAMFHLFNHAIFKSLLFVNSAAVELEAGTTDMDKLRGLAKKMPLTGWSSVLAGLSCAGVPPLAGFWSKLIIVIALWTAGYYVYAVIAVLASILTLAYFLSLQRRVFFGVLGEGLKQVKEAGWGLAIPTIALAALTVGAGVFFPYLTESFIVPIKSILGG